MADDVIVTFGARIDELVSGVEGAKSAVEGFGESFKSLAEIVGVSLSVEAFREFVLSSAEAAEHIERMSAILGSSTTGVQQLGFIAKMTGGNMDGMSLAMERFQVNLQRAATGTGLAFNALTALGISAKSLIGLPLDEQMNRIADAVSKFADGGNKTAIVMELFGRSGAQLIPVLDKGRAGLEGLRQAAADSGAVMSQSTVKSLVDLQHSLVAAGSAAVGLGGTLVGQFSGALTSVIDKVTEFITDIALLIQTHALWDAALKNLTNIIEYAALQLLRFAKVAQDVMELNFVAAFADWTRLAPTIGAAGKALSDELTPALAKSRAELRAMLAETEAVTKPNAPSSAGPNTQAMKDAATAAQEQIKQDELIYQTKIQRLAAELKMHQITQAQETAETIKAIGERSLAEINALTEAQSHMAKNSEEWRKLENEKTTITLKAVKDRQATELKAMEETSKQWQAVGSSIASAFNSQTKALLSGTENFATAMKNIFADLVVALINELEKLIVKEAIAEGLKIAIEGPAALIPGFAEGTSYVPQTGLALLHQGEAVIPASQNIGGITGSNITINASQLDTSGMRAMLMQLVPQISQMVSNHQSQQFSTYGAH